METVGRHCSHRERQRSTETGFWDGDVGRLGTWWMRLEKWAVLGFEHYPLHSSDSLCIQLAFLGDVGTSEGEHIHWTPTECQALSRSLHLLSLWFLNPSCGYYLYSCCPDFTGGGRN